MREKSPLIGESIEQVGRPADQPGRRLVPGPCEQRDVAEELVNHAHRHLRRQVGDEVDAAAFDQRIEARRTVGPYVRLDLRDSPRGKEAGQEGTVRIVKGRVLEEDRAQREVPT